MTTQTPVAQRATIKRVVIYIRISKDRENETSTGTQEFEARAHCEVKGWEVIAVCVDPGRSAFKRGVKRPELEQALELVEVGAADILLVWKLDRFTRSVTDFWDYWTRISNAGGAFVSLKDDIETVTAKGRMMLGIIASFAEMESEMKSERTKSWNDGRKREGATPPGPRPYGYDRTPNTLTINEPEAKVIREAAKRILLGGSLKSVIAEMAPTSSRGGKPMTYRGLRNTLLADTTYGYRRAEDGSIIKGCWAPILDEQTYAQMTALLTDPSRRTGTTNQVRHMLTGIMVCGKADCGDTVGVRNWVNRSKAVGKAQRYQCKSCGNSLWHDDADEAVTAFLMSAVPQEDWQTLKIQGRGYNPAIIAELEDEAESYVAMAQRGTIKPAQLESIMQGINERIASAMGDEALDLPDVANLAESWETMSVTDKRRVLKGVGITITLMPANGVRGIDRLQVTKD